MKIIGSYDNGTLKANVVLNHSGLYHEGDEAADEAIELANANRRRNR